MKKLSRSVAALLLLATISSRLSTVFAQGTAFTYQGQLNLNGSPANGLYDFTFSLSSNPQGTIITAVTGALGVPVTNGLFTTTIDFGAGQFIGTSNWLQIAVRTNLVGNYTNLSPLQLLTPTPYAIFANTASNLSGTVPAGHVSGTLGNGQLANSSIIVIAGSGLSGGGQVPLGGSTTLSNAGVLSVTGNADITATTASGAVTLGDTATNASLPNTIVKRDGSGNFTNNSITLNGNLNLTNMSATAGIIYSGGDPLIYSVPGAGVFSAGSASLNLFAFGGVNNTGVGTFALYSIKTGQNNTAVGYNALTTTGSTVDSGAGDNTAIGSSALTADTGGYRNTAVGSSALYRNTLGVENTAVGYLALYTNSTGQFNTAIGDAALANSTANENTAVGAGALANTSAGFQNIALGYQAGQNITLGGTNIDIGSQGSSTDTNITRIGSTQTYAYVAGVVNGMGGVQVGNIGTVFTNVQAGQALMPSGGSATVETNLTIAFPQAFSTIPKIIVSAANDPGFPDVNDTFVVSVSSNSVSAFRVNVVRVDTPTGWSQQLRINWQAWE